MRYEKSRSRLRLFKRVCRVCDVQTAQEQLLNAEINVPGHRCTLHSCQTPAFVLIDAHASPCRIGFTSQFLSVKRSPSTSDEQSRDPELEQYELSVSAVDAPLNLENHDLRRSHSPAI